MPPNGPLITQFGRSAHLGLALLRSTAFRPSAPLKLNLCLTYWCQYKCKTCNIWQRKPTDELTTAEIAALVREKPLSARRATGYVKAIAEATRVRMPSFFAYMLYSGGILLPVFAAVTWLFFRS